MKRCREPRRWCRPYRPRKLGRLCAECPPAWRRPNSLGVSCYGVGPLEGFDGDEPEEYVRRLHARSAFYVEQQSNACRCGA